MHKHQISMTWIMHLARNANMSHKFLKTVWVICLPGTKVSWATTTTLGWLRWEKCGVSTVFGLFFLFILLGLNIFRYFVRYEYVSVRELGFKWKFGLFEGRFLVKCLLWRIYFSLQIKDKIFDSWVENKKREEQQNIYIDYLSTYSMMLIKENALQNIVLAFSLFLCLVHIPTHIISYWWKEEVMVEIIQATQT